MDGKIYENLIELAFEARKNSYTPYSNFNVGACLLSKSGKKYLGCNIESASYSPTNCAERTAFFKAVSEGEKEFEAIAVVGGFDDGDLNYCYPCGVCRQVMREFCDTESFEIIVGRNKKDYKVYKLKELLPFSFGPDELEKK